MARNLSDINAKRSTVVGGLRRKQNSAWREYQDAVEARMVAQLEEHRHPSDANKQALALAWTDERSARACWVKAARAWQQAAQLEARAA